MYQGKPQIHFTILAILTTIKRKKIHRDQYSHDNAVCYLFCQPFYSGDALLSTCDNLLENKVSTDVLSLSGTSILIWKNSHLHAELACICHNHRISRRLLARLTHFHCEAQLWEGGRQHCLQAVIGSTNCSQSHLTSCENFSHLRSCERQSW